MIKAGKIRLFSLDRRQIMAILLSCLATALSLKIPLLLKQVIDHGKMLSRTSSLGQIGFCLLISSLLEAGSQRLANGSLSFGMLSSFIMYMFGIISPINNLSNFYMSYAEARGSLKASSEILAQPDEADPGQELPKKAADLKVRDLTFAYPGSQSPVLRDLSLDFKEGAKTALVGPSGAGKTTLINLLTRLEAGYQGRILLGDLEAKSCSLPAWQDLFSVVAQDNNIFAGTVADNLLFGLEKSASRSDMIQALQVANLWPELDLDTQTGEGGWKLSLGQSQRLQLARAYLRDAPCLILDEATANLDPESEAKVSQAVDRIAREKIVIIIAHRLSTIANADKIYFLDQGQVQAAGQAYEALTR